MHSRQTAPSSSDDQWLDDSGDWRLSPSDRRQRMQAEALSMTGRQSNSHEFFDICGTLELDMDAKHQIVLESLRQRARSYFLIQTSVFQAAATRASRQQRVHRALMNVAVGNYTRARRPSRKLPTRKYFLERYSRHGCVFDGAGALTDPSAESSLTVAEALELSRTELDSIVAEKRVAVQDAVRRRHLTLEMLNQCRDETYEHFAADYRKLVEHRRSRPSVCDREEKFLQLFLCVFPEDLQEEVSSERTAARLFERLRNEELSESGAIAATRRSQSTSKLRDITDELFAAYPSLENLADVPVCSRKVHAGSSLIQPAGYVSGNRARREHVERCRAALERWTPLDRLRFFQAFYYVPKEWAEIAARCGFSASECIEYYYLRKGIPLRDPIGYAIDQYRHAAAESTTNLVVTGSDKGAESFDSLLRRRIQTQPAWFDAEPRILPLWIKEHTQQMIWFRDKTRGRKVRLQSARSGSGQNQDRSKTVASIRVGDIAAQQHWKKRVREERTGGPTASSPSGARKEATVSILADGGSRAGDGGLTSEAVAVSEEDEQRKISQMAEGLLQSVVDDDEPTVSTSLQ